MTAVVKRDPDARVAYSIIEVARLFGRDRVTIHRWLEQGLLREIRIPRRHRMVDARSVEKLLRGEAPRPRKPRVEKSAEK